MLKPSVFSDATNSERRTMKRTKSSLLAFKLREVRRRTRMPATRLSQLLVATRAHERSLCDCQQVLTGDNSSILRLSCIAQFLDTRDLATPEPMRTGMLEPSQPPPSQRRSSAYSSPVPQPDVDKVWVDCFYYGFYMEKSKLPAFQASLRQNPAFQKQYQHKQAVAT